MATKEEMIKRKLKGMRTHITELETCRWGTDCKNKAIFHYCQEHGWAEELERENQRLRELLEETIDYVGIGTLNRAELRRRIIKALNKEGEK